MLRKELSYYFSGPIAYIVIGLYLVTISLFLWVIPGQWNIVASGYASLDGIFQLSPWLMMLLCPALTMRLVVEERTSGTWILLRAKKVPIWKIIGAKYIAAWTLTLLAILPNFVHYMLLYYIAEPIGNVDAGQFLGSMLGLTLLSASFTGIGLMAGCVTRSQLVAFLIGAVANFALFWVSLQQHYQSISRGVLDLRDVVFMLSIAGISILVSIILVDKADKK